MHIFFYPQKIHSDCVEDVSAAGEADDFAVESFKAYAELKLM